MAARWQRLWICGLALALVGWLLWLWPQSKALALAGVLLPLGLHMGILAGEFGLMQRANRHAGGPVASGAQCLAAWWAEVRWGWQIFGWSQPFRHHTQPDWSPVVPTGACGVVLIHGALCNRGFWLRWLPSLRAAGHAYEAVSLVPSMGPIDGHVATIEAAVQRITQATGQPPVLLCHSMGGLVARAWLRAGRNDARVRRVITLGTPHAGTWLARYSTRPAGRQMRLGSDWLQALAAAEPESRAALFVCWYSACDNIVFPAHTAALAGAEHRWVPHLAHVQMAQDPAVIAACLHDMRHATGAGSERGAWELPGAV